MDRKKILAAFGFILLMIGIGFAIWWVFFRIAPTLPPGDLPTNAAPGTGGLIPSEPGQPPTVPVTPPGELPPSTASPIADGGLTVVTPVAPVQTVGASVSTAGTLSYWNRTDGKFYRVGADGVPVSLSGKRFYNVKDATFNAGGDKAIIEYPDGANIMYDFNTSRQVTLPNHWQDFDFNAGGDRIVAKSIGTDVDSRYLFVSNPDGSSATAVQALGENADKVIVAWSPSEQIVAISQTGPSNGLGVQDVYFIGQNQENFKSLSVPGMNFEPKWSPNGQQLLFSCATESQDWRPGLWIVDAVGDDIGRNRRYLNVNTWADKCTFADAATLYCAVPDYLQRGAGLQPAIADETPDTIYRIDLTTGSQTRIAVPEGEHTIGELMPTPDGKTLYFTDKNSGVLSKIQLAP